MQPDSNGNPDRAATLLTFTNEPHRFDISLSLKKKQQACVFTDLLLVIPNTKVLALTQR
jgi:hypothetical protein